MTVHEESSVEIIECAAIKSSYDNKIYAMERPNRHHNIIHYLAFEVGLPTPIKGNQGFLTSRGRFVDRKEASAIAFFSRQIKDDNYKISTLYSEDLW